METSRRRHGRAFAALVAGALAVSAAAAPAAHAIPPEAELVDAAQYGWLASDGDRRVAYSMPDGTLKVVDEGAERSAFQVPIPAGCTPSYGGIAVGGGQVVVLCSTPATDQTPRSSGAQRLDLATRTWSQVPGSDRWRPDGDGGYVGLRGVGARWIAIERSDDQMRWADWRTGAVRADDGDAREAPDLDDEQLFAPMCAPLQRPLPERQLSQQAFMPTAYQQPFAISLHASYQLAAQACDEPRATVIGGGIDPAQLGGGIATWQSVAEDPTGDTFAYLPACRQRLGWWVGTPGQTAHVRGALYLMESTPGGGPVRRLPLPTGCLTTPRATVRGTGARARSQAVLAREWTNGGTYGATANRLPQPGTTAPLVRSASRSVEVRTRTGVRGVAWRAAGQRSWQSARATRRDRRTWRVVAPRGRGVHRLELRIGDRAGGVALHDVRVRTGASGS